MYLFQMLIGYLDCPSPLWLTIVITMVLVLQDSIEKHSYYMYLLTTLVNQITFQRPKIITLP